MIQPHANHRRTLLFREQRGSNQNRLSTDTIRPAAVDASSGTNTNGVDSDGRAA